jgi:parallel beta-helix repeat protein
MPRFDQATAGNLTTLTGSEEFGAWSGGAYKNVLASVIKSYIETSIGESFSILVGDTGYPDYITDGAADQTEVNAAITTAYSRGGGIVYLQAQSFSLTGQIIMKPGVALVGLSRSGTILFMSTDYSNAVVSIDGASNCKISDLTIDGNSGVISATSGDNTRNGITISGACTNVLIENVTAQNTPGNGFYSESSSITSNVLLMNCETDTAGTRGAYIQSDGVNIIGGHYHDSVYHDGVQFEACEDGLALGVHAYDNSVKGFECQVGASNIEFSNCHSYGNGGAGVEVANGCTDINISGCYVFNNDGTGVSFKQEAGNPCIGGTISDCTIYGNGVAAVATGISGVTISGCYEITITNSSIYGNARHGVLVQNGGIGTVTNAQRVEVKNNRIYNNSQLVSVGDGVAIYGDVESVLVLDNTIYDNQGVATQRYGVQINASTVLNTRVKRNEIFDNATGDILDNGTDTQYESGSGIKQSRVSITVDATGSGADYECDGTADDVQIQAAIDAVNAAGGGFVDLASITFNTNDTIILKDGVSLRGQDWDTIIKIAAADTYVITNENTSTTGDTRAAVYNMTIDGNSALTHTTDVQAGIRFFGVKYPIIENVQLKDNYGMGVWITETTGDATAGVFSIVRGNKVTNSGHHNISVDSGGGVVEDNYCDGTTNYDNIQVDTADRFRVVNNTCKNATRDNIRAMTYTDQTNEETLISGNVCDTGVHNIMATTNTAGVTQRRTIISDNHCINSTGWSIVAIRNPKTTIADNIVTPGADTTYTVYVKDSDGSLVTGNQSDATVASGGRGAYIENSDYCTITSNSFSNHDQQGIELSGSNYGVISDNNLFGNRTGVELTNSSYSVVSSNNISDCSFRGVEENGTADYNFVDGNKFYAITSDIVTLIGAHSYIGDNMGLAATRNRTRSADYTVTSADNIINISASGAARTITLPSVDNRSEDDPVLIVKTDTSANNVTIVPDGTDTVNGTSSVLLRGQRSSVLLRAEQNGNNWVVVSSYDTTANSFYEQGNITGAITFTRVNGRTITATLTGNITPTITNGVVKGDRLTLILTQDGTGSRTVTWPSNFKKAGGTLTLSTAAGAVDVIEAEWDGSNWREVSRSMGLA